MLLSEQCQDTHRKGRALSSTGHLGKQERGELGWMKSIEGFPQCLSYWLGRKGFIPTAPSEPLETFILLTQEDSQRSAAGEKAQVTWTAQSLWPSLGCKLGVSACTGWFYIETKKQISAGFSPFFPGNLGKDTQNVFLFYGWAFKFLFSFL